MAFSPPSDGDLSTSAAPRGATAPDAPAESPPQPWPSSTSAETHARRATIRIGAIVTPTGATRRAWSRSCAAYRRVRADAASARSAHAGGVGAARLSGLDVVDADAGTAEAVDAGGDRVGAGVARIASGEADAVRAEEPGLTIAVDHADAVEADGRHAGAAGAPEAGDAVGIGDAWVPLRAGRDAGTERLHRR